MVRQNSAAATSAHLNGTSNPQSLELTGEDYSALKKPWMIKRIYNLNQMTMESVCRTRRTQHVFGK
jgi:hypothetical protein